MDDLFLNLPNQHRLYNYTWCTIIVHQYHSTLCRKSYALSHWSTWWRFVAGVWVGHVVPKLKQIVSSHIKTNNYIYWVICTTYRSWTVWSIDGKRISSCWIGRIIFPAICETIFECFYDDAFILVSLFVVVVSVVSQEISEPLTPVAKDCDRWLCSFTFMVKCSHIGITNRRTPHTMRDKSMYKNVFCGDSLFKAKFIVGYCKTADKIDQTPTPVPNILPNVPAPNTFWQYKVIVV